MATPLLQLDEQKKVHVNTNIKDVLPICAQIPACALSLSGEKNCTHLLPPADERSHVIVKNSEFPITGVLKRNRCGA